MSFVDSRKEKKNQQAWFFPKKLLGATIIQEEAQHLTAQTYQLFAKVAKHYMQKPRGQRLLNQQSFEHGALTHCAGRNKKICIHAKSAEAATVEPLGERGYTYWL